MSWILFQGEDHVTLVTCTPYGVNTHRLLIRGIRTEYVEPEEKSRGDTSSRQIAKVDPSEEHAAVGLVAIGRNDPHRLSGDPPQEPKRTGIE